MKNNKNSLEDTSIINKRKDEFIDRTVNHPILHDVFTILMGKVEESKKGRVYQVFDPTGVGKTTLYSRVGQEIINRNKKAVHNNRSIIPVISLELPSPDNGKFNWKDFYRRMLKELNEPLIDYKVSIKGERGKRKKVPDYLPTTAPALRESLENAIYHRQTTTILLDEAQHLLKIPGNRAIQDQMDAIKSIANLTGVVFVLFGTYELMAAFDLNGQLGRRTDEIHFRRYNLKNTKDSTQFKSVVYTFQTQLPFKQESDLLKHWEFLYERSIGCIGVLKEWLDLCVIDAINNKLPSISYQLLDKHAPSPSKALLIAKEATEGERFLDKQEEARYKLKELLGLNKEKKETENDRTKTKKKVVGRRNPTRDKIG